MSKIEVNAIEPQCGTNLTVGASGDTITFPSGTTVVNNGSQTGFGRTGTVDWDTTAKTASFTAVSGNGYFVNTTSGAITVTLPAGSANAIVAISDYASTFQTNNVTITPNGSDNINGVNDDATLSTQGIAVSLVYVDATRGWKSVTGSDNDTTGVIPSPFVTATGGTITTSGDYKIHTFTGPGTFCVSQAGTPSGSTTVDYLVVAGGGGGAGASNAGGAGAGGYRESSGAASGCYTASPLGACVSALPVSVQGYPITVGSGGVGRATPPNGNGTNGGTSIFSSITSAGGGGGGSSGTPANAGGSGGGDAYDTNNPTGGAGNTPPVSPPQGQPGGGSSGPVDGPFYGAHGGGGAGAAGGIGSPSTGGAGGAGVTSSINGTPTARAGGGGGGTNSTVAPGGAGGGGSGGTSATPAPPTGGAGVAGTANTGGGGGGTGQPLGCGGVGGNGGSGIVIIRYKFQ